MPNSPAIWTGPESVPPPSLHSPLDDRQWRLGRHRVRTAGPVLRGNTAPGAVCSIWQVSPEVKEPPFVFAGFCPHVSGVHMAATATGIVN